MENKHIPFLVPDMPTALDLEPWLKQIDLNRYYANFGPLLKQFEAEITDYLQNFAAEKNFLVSCSTGTSALELALLALDLPPQSRILMPALTFVATALAVIRAGHIPVFSDVDEHSWLLTPDIAYQHLQQQKIAAIMPVATYGAPLNAAAWDTFSQETNLPIIIDGAGAFANQHIGRKTIVVFSLHATKLLGIGEGGLIACCQQTFIEKIRAMTNFGLIENVLEYAGTNSKLSEYHAVVGLAQLARWQDKQQRFQHLRKIYQHALLQIPHLKFQQTDSSIISSLLPIRLTNLRDNQIDILLSKLEQQGIQTKRVYFPTLDHQPALQSYANNHELPVIRTLEKQLFCLPFHHLITEQNIEYISQALDFLHNRV